MRPTGAAPEPRKMRALISWSPALQERKRTAGSQTSGPARVRPGVNALAIHRMRIQPGHLCTDQLCALIAFRQGRGERSRGGERDSRIQEAAKGFSREARARGDWPGDVSGKPGPRAHAPANARLSKFSAARDPEKCAAKNVGDLDVEDPIRQSNLPPGPD